MKTLIIPIHSFVDLITNSSSETYISATSATVQSVKEIIKNLLSLADSSKTADDFFDIDIGYDDVYIDEKLKEFAKSIGIELGKYNDCFLTETNINKIKEFVDNNPDLEDCFEDPRGRESCSSSLVISPKQDLGSEDSLLAAKIAVSLSKLINTYSIEARYNG